MKGYKMDLVPMIDVEPSDKEMAGKSVKDLQKNLDKFIALVKAEYGVPPMIYDKSDDMQAYAVTFIVDEENAMHLSPECRFYGFNIRAVSE